MEYYINAIAYLYGRSKTKVHTLKGCNKEFQIDAGIHQASAISPFLFTFIVYVLTECIGTGPPNAMIFADNLVTY